MQYGFKAHAVKYCEYCGRTAGRIETPLGKYFTGLQIFSLEFFLHRAVGARAWGLSLASLMDSGVARLWGAPVQQSLGAPQLLRPSPKCWERGGALEGPAVGERCKLLTPQWGPQPPRVLMLFVFSDDVACCWKPLRALSFHTFLSRK